jgi:hypothetical protein
VCVCVCVCVQISLSATTPLSKPAILHKWWRTLTCAPALTARTPVCYDGTQTKQPRACFYEIVAKEMRERREGGSRVMRTVKDREGLGDAEVVLHMNSGRRDTSAHFVRMYVPGTSCCDVSPEAARSLFQRPACVAGENVLHIRPCGGRDSIHPCNGQTEAFWVPADEFQTACLHDRMVLVGWVGQFSVLVTDVLHLNRVRRTTSHRRCWLR